MSIKTFAKKNKLFSGVTVGFLIWILILAIVGLIGTRTVVFYDALAQTNVSSQYKSIIPVARYLIEPFAAIAFAMQDGFEWIVLFLISYVIIRIGYLSLVKKGYVRSKKFHILKYIVDDFLIFIFQVCAPMFLFVAIVMGIAILTVGFYFVNLYWNAMLHVEMMVCFILLFIKLVYLLATLLHPNLRYKYMDKKRHQPIERGDKKKIYYRYSKREFVYFMSMLMIAFNFNFLMISIQYPTQVIQTSLASDEILMDLHVHTTYSDGWLTPEQRVLWYMEQGISVAAFADHDNQRGAIAAQAFVARMGLDFTVLLAEEWTDHENDIHMNIYGLAETIVPPESETVGGPKAMYAKETIEYVKNNGGFVTVNHYNVDDNGTGGIGVPYTLEQLRDWGADGFEIMNGNSYKNKYVTIREFCLNNSLICMSGSDIHSNEPLTSFIKLKLDDPTNKSIENIFKHLRYNNHSTVAVEPYPIVFNTPGALDDIGFTQIDRFWNYLFNIDSYQALSWILWSCGFYAMFVLVYREIKKVNLSLLKEKIL